MAIKLWFIVWKLFLFFLLSWISGFEIDKLTDLGTCDAHVTSLFWLAWCVNGSLQKTEWASSTKFDRDGQFQFTLTTKKDSKVHLDYIDGLVQERRSSIANALELRLSCTNPSILLMNIFLSCRQSVFQVHGGGWGDPWCQRWPSPWRGRCWHDNDLHLSMCYLLPICNW